MSRSAVRLAAIVLAVPIIAAIALAAFAWPSANLAPRGLPLGLTGPAQARMQLASRLQAAHPGGFDLHTYADGTAARSAIGDREIYGALVVTPAGTTLLTASAASPLVAQLLTQIVAAVAGGTNGAAGSTPSAAAGALWSASHGGHGAASTVPHVIDVVPAAAGDPRGSALGSAVLPLVLAGVIGALLITTASRPGIAQVAALVVASSLAGLVADAVVQGWLGVIDGNWAANAGALALTILAIAATIAGLSALLGSAGLGLGGLLMVFLGNPFSGVSSAPELLPTPVGTIGQLLPPGAGGNLLRSTASFDGNGAGPHIAVLAGWLVIGLAAMTLGVLRRRNGDPTDALPGVEAPRPR